MNQQEIQGVQFEFLKVLRPVALQAMNLFQAKQDAMFVQEDIIVPMKE